MGRAYAGAKGMAGMGAARVPARRVPPGAGRRRRPLPAGARRRRRRVFPENHSIVLP